ncbi:MAG: DUF4105 domain-containing protein [Pirellulales bacterium]
MDQMQGVAGQVESVDRSAARSWWLRPLTWMWLAVAALFQLGLVIWSTLAVYFSNLPWPALRLALALVVAGLGVWCWWVDGRPKWRWAYLGLFAVLVIWFLLIPPSHDRPWRREVAVMPRAEVEGDRVRLTGVRDFEYRGVQDFDERYIEREVSIDHLQSVDLFLSYWTPGPVGHTFVSFNFDNSPPVCISIETRPEEGEGFAPIASLFRQFELIYVVGEERDLVGVRASHRQEEVYMYRIRMTPEAARRLFRIYLDRINELAERPEWYHLLKNSCTVNIVRYANMAGREGRFDFRHLLNGWVDAYLYSAGRIDTSLPFDELRRRSHINDAARAAAGSDDFHARIRVDQIIPE